MPKMLWGDLCIINIRPLLKSRTYATVHASANERISRLRSQS